MVHYVKGDVIKCSDPLNSLWRKGINYLVLEESESACAGYFYELMEINRNPRSSRSLFLNEFNASKYFRKNGHVEIPENVGRVRTIDDLLGKTKELEQYLPKKRFGLVL